MRKTALRLFSGASGAAVLTGREALVFGAATIVIVTIAACWIIGDEKRSRRLERLLRAIRSKR